MEEVDERAFRGNRGANAHHFALGAAGVYEDLLGAPTSSKDMTNRLGLGDSSATSFLMATSSLEATIAMACS